MIEKMGYALVMATQKLKPYFEANKVVVLTNQPLKKIMQKYECSGRMLNWVVEVACYGIEFEPQWAIQAQALVDFVMECFPQRDRWQPQSITWKVYVDGSSFNQGSGVGIMLKNPDGEVFK